MLYFKTTKKEEMMRKLFFIFFIIIICPTKSFANYKITFPFFSKNSSFNNSSVISSIKNGQVNAFDFNGNKVYLYVTDLGTGSEEYALVAYRVPSSVGSAVSSGTIKEDTTVHYLFDQGWNILWNNTLSNPKIAIKTGGKISFTLPKNTLEKLNINTPITSLSKMILIHSEDSGTNISGLDYDLLGAPSGYSYLADHAVANNIWQNHIIDNSARPQYLYIYVQIK